MKNYVNWQLAAAAMALMVMLPGCGGGGHPSVSAAPAVPQAITVSITASPTHLGAAETYQFAAKVSNSSDTAVVWSLAGCASACGTITDTGLYSAAPFIPNAGPVTITATSHADSSKSASVTIPLIPVSVALVPNGTINVVPGGTRTFAATLDHDPKNAGVTWSLSSASCAGDACGTLSNTTATSVMYRAPSSDLTPNTVTLTAVSVTDPNQKRSIMLTVSATATLAGKYAFLINGWGYDSSYWQRQAIAGQFSADGNGNLTGVWDASRGAGVDVAQAITGNYNLQPNGHGTMTIHAGPTTFTYVLSLNMGGATGRFADTGVTPAAISGHGSSGYLVRQDETSFSLAAIAGDRVAALFGEATGSHVAALGRFTATTAGMLNNGTMDLSWYINQNAAHFANAVTLTGNFVAPDASTGRGTAAFGVTGGTEAATYHFAYYMVSNDRLLVVQTDARGMISGLLIPALSGEIRAQRNAGGFSQASLNAPVVFYVIDSTDDWLDMGYPLIRIGQMAPNGSGALSMIFDQNVGGRDPEMIGFQNGGKITLNGTTTGTYSVSANGRALWMLPPGMVFPTIDEMDVAYLIENNEGFLMTPDLDGAGFGAFEVQTGTPFTLAGLAGSYRLNTGPPTNPDVESDAGWMEVDSSGNVSATLYVNPGLGASVMNVTGSVSVAANGRGTLVLNTAAQRDLVFWAMSPDRWVAISTVDKSDSKPVLLFIERQ